MMKKTLLLLMIALLSAGCSLITGKHWKNQKAAVTTPPDGVTEPPPESRLKLANRTQLGSILTSIFGPSVKPDTDSMIVNNGFHFGGACDAYSADAACGAGTLPNPIPLPITSREALLSRICERIASTDTAIQYAAGQVLGSTGDPMSARPGPADILKSYDLFFPGATAPTEIVSSLNVVVQTAQTNGYAPLESWRFLFLSECLMPEWQIL
jgi:hypothetical protein